MIVLVKKIALGFVVFLIVAIIATYGFFRHEIDQMLGGNTTVVGSSQFQYVSGKLAITNVSVLAEDSSLMLPNQTVLINGETIEAVGSDLEIPDNFIRINAEGKFLIPGLIDSHVHVKKSQNDLLLYIANGVTHIAEMTGMTHHFDLRDAINDGQIGPTMFIASPKVNNSDSFKAVIRSTFEKRHQSFLTPQEARDAVIDFKERGFDAIKLSSDLSSDIYYALNDEAKKVNIPVIGHLPVGLDLNDLYKSGQSQLAHIDSIVLTLMNKHGWITSKNHKEFLKHIAEQADDIADSFKERNIAVASTVWLHKTRPQQDFDLTGFLKSIELEYQNPGWLEGSLVSKGCLPGDNSYENPHNTDPESQRESEIFHQTYFDAIKIITQALVKRKVTITAGTDALGACGMIAGFSIHKELETLNKLGLTNAQVIQSATSVPAEWMKIKAGIIRPGYRADLILLNKNPLDDIRHSQDIHSVVTKGKLLNRMELDRILEAVKNANKESRTISIDEYMAAN